MELEVGKVSLNLERVQLRPSDLLAIKVPAATARPEVLNRISEVVTGVLRRAGLENQVLVMPDDFHLSALSRDDAQAFAEQRERAGV